MKRVLLVVAFLLSLFLVLLSAQRYPVFSALVPNTAISSVAKGSGKWETGDGERRTGGNVKKPRLVAAESKAGEDDKPKTFDQIVQGAERLEGLFTLYRDRSAGKLYVEIRPDQLNVNYLCNITLESGIGQSGIYSGLPLTDFLFTFRRVDDKIQFVVPNLYFRTKPGDPLQRSVQRSFSNSVLQALSIKSYNPKHKSYLVDLGPLFLSDFPGLTPMLSTVLGSPYTLDTNRSYFDAVKSFPLNVELESVYGFSGGNGEDAPAFLEVLPDNRSFDLKIRYSLSKLPASNGYRPRLADDRVGYFITAYQDFSDDSPRTPFVRYINRWHLEKQDPNAPLSPPKQPIVFWIENTVPLEYRDAVREGALMWNQAFEKAGFKDAVQVKQMPDDATWDPADIRYNTIRWISSFDSGFIGLGPSRVNPLSGEILDADILIDASFARYMKQQYQTLAQQNQMRVMPSLEKLTGNPDLCSYGVASHYLKRSTIAKPSANPNLTLQLVGNYDLCLGLEASRQLAIGSMAMTMLQGIPLTSSEMKQYVQEFLRTLIAHEIGHTLGLRHNFRASAMLSPAELNNPEVTHRKGLVGSVMDYTAVNLAPPGTKQGDYFTHRVGPYDEWAIAYGYTPTSAFVPQAETRLLDKISRQAPESDLGYATDEDAFARLDPLVNRFDLSNDLLTYAPWQLENAHQMWQRLDQRFPASGESFNDVRMMFDEVFDYYFQYSRFLTSYVGGQSFNRFRGGDAAGRLPFEPIPLEKQRQALALLQKYVFDESQFHFSPEFLNKLAPSRWSHWGETPEFQPLDYPIYDRILLLQSAILNELLGKDHLARLRDAELKTAAGKAFTLPELFDTLQTSIWREVLQPTDNLHLSSLRRGLQREQMNTLIRMVLRSVDVPEDARTLAWYNLKQLRLALDKTLRKDNIDALTRAHLEESSDRITKALNAQLQTQ
jgi:hypothetical protein